MPSNDVKISLNIDNPIGESLLLQEMYEIGLALTSELNSQDVLVLVATSAKRLLNADIVTCHALDQITGRYGLAADIGEKKQPDLNRDATPEGPTATIVRTGEYLSSNNALIDDTPFRSSPFTIAENIKSVMGIPLMKRSDVLGVLYINFRNPNMISDRVRKIGQMLANQAAIALFNADLFHYLSEREKSKSRLAEVAKRISSAIADSTDTAGKPTVKFVLDEIAKAACEVSEANCAVIYPYDDSHAEFYDVESIGAWGITTPFHPSDRPRSASGMAAFINRERMVIRGDIESEDPNMLKSAFIERERIRAFVGVALAADSSALGVLYVNYRKPKDFTPEQIETIRLFAEHATVALQIARLLEKEQEELADLETLTLLDSLGHHFAHDLNGAVGLIGTATGEIERIMTLKEPLDPRIERLLGAIKSKVAQLVEAVDNLRAYKDVQPLEGDSEPVDINALTALQVSAYKDSGIEFIETYAQDITVVTIPRDQFGKVIDNIIRNAVEHSQPGNVIRVETQIDLENRTIQISIADQGAGIQPERIKKLFRFESDKLGHLGYGLWWSNRFIMRHGGRIRVSSIFGSGSIFTIILPIRSA